IAELNETQSYHTADGTPRRIEFQLTIERVDDDVLRTTREKNTRKDKR
ncbi:phage tail protein, partial [Burkholderia pseudomallei]